MSGSPPPARHAPPRSCRGATRAPAASGTTATASPRSGPCGSPPSHAEHHAWRALDRRAVQDLPVALERRLEPGLRVVREDVLAARRAGAGPSGPPWAPTRSPAPGPAGPAWSDSIGRGTLRPMARWWTRARARRVASSARSNSERRSRRSQPMAGLGSARSWSSGRIRVSPLAWRSRQCFSLAAGSMSRATTREAVRGGDGGVAAGVRAEVPDHRPCRRPRASRRRPASSLRALSSSYEDAVLP